MEVVPRSNAGGATDWLATRMGNRIAARNGNERAAHDAKQPDLSDLLTQIGQGSARALQRLIDCAWPRLTRYAARELGDTDLAEDVVQEAFIYLWRRRTAWSPGGSPQAYLYRIVRNRLIDEKRKRCVRAHWARSQAHLEQPRHATPAEELECNALVAVFDDAVRSLPDRRREAFNLVFLSGLSHQEAAEVMGVSKQTVSNQVTAALASVRAAIARARGEIP